MIPQKAFILAAGLGKRLRPYTDDLPKPLVDVNGRTLLDRTLDHLENAGAGEAVINTHYLADKITAHLARRESPRIHFSHEPQLLDTGGGIKNALNYFGDEPFFVISGDGLWTDGPSHGALKRLADAWDPEAMDILILLQPLSTFNFTEGVGDYDLAPDGRARRALDKTGKHMFTSIRINHPRIFKDSPDGAFSYLDLLDKAEAAGRLYGLVHDGEWHHISTPEDLEAANAAFKGKSA